MQLYNLYRCSKIYVLWYEYNYVSSLLQSFFGNWINLLSPPYVAFRYRATLFSPWKQRGMYATCMWVVELLLVLSDSKTIFQYVPEFYVESLVSLLFHLAFCFSPIHSEPIYLRGSSFYYLCRLIVSMPCEGVTLLLFHLQYSSNKGWHHLYVPCILSSWSILFFFKKSFHLNPIPSFLVET